jgi:hypothetical protein
MLQWLGRLQRPASPFLLPTDEYLHWRGRLWQRVDSDRMAVVRSTQWHESATAPSWGRLTPPPWSPSWIIASVSGEMSLVRFVNSVCSLQWDSRRCRDAGEGTSLAGCQAAVAAASQCSPPSSCCETYYDEYQECVGVPGVTSATFREDVKRQALAAGCPGAVSSSIQGFATL